MDFDLVIRGGTIADGTGTTPLFEGDVALKDAKIAAVGKVSGKGKEEIDAKGKLVTPGFVDIHTHYDGQAMWESRLIPSSFHGVTTTVFGNCGVGFAPVTNANRDLLIELMEGIEDIPAPVLREGLDWKWNSFGEFLDALDRLPHDMDFCAQIPHAALRIHTMGKRAMNIEKATAAEIAEMRRLTAEAIKAGAIGFSSARLPTHQTKKGDPSPTLGATDDELVEVAMGVKDAGKGVIQFTCDFPAKERKAELDLVRRILRETGRPLSLTLRQRHNDPESWREVLAAMHEANAQGARWRGQMAPRSVGTLFGLRMSRHPFVLHPSFQPLADKPLEEKVKAFRDPAFRAKLLSEQPVHKNARNIARVQTFERMFLLGDPPDYEPPPDGSVENLAKAQKRTPWEVAYDMLLEDEGHSLLYCPASNYAAFNLDAVKTMMEDPYTCLGLSDGGAHVAGISDANFPTWILTHWGRDRSRGGKIDLAWLVRWMTGATADTVGLTDRGRIKVGLKADINVIDHDRLKVGRPYMTYDLPCSGKRMLQTAEGYVATILSGVAVSRDDKPTGALPGRLVRS
jgi:N-acyl-D-aspartate/D-glutamate deacylase